MTANGDHLTPPYGTPARELLKQHDSDITGLKGAMQTVVDEVSGLRGDVAEVKGIAMRLEGSVETLRRTTLRPPSLPPMRGELDSQIQLRPLAEAIKEAALRGERLDGTTPEAEVEAVVERAELIRLGRRTRAMLNKALWLAVAGGASLIAEHIIAAIAAHH